MNAINFIAKNMVTDLSKANILECEEGTICAFTGEKITHGSLLKNITKGNFTEYEYVKFKSQFVGVDVIKVLSECISTGESRCNSLRNYSYLATNNEFKILTRDDFWELLLNPPSPPYVLAYSYNNKKHTSFKAKITFDDNMKITTDTDGIVSLPVAIRELLCPIIQSWYSATTDMPKTDTYFIKEEILFGSDNTKKIERYGVEKYFAENKILAKYRNTNTLKLLTRLVNRKCV